ncbi:MAG: VOC family protein [Thermoanaerobaculia bacterium]
MLTKLTPVLIVDAIEPVLPFWQSLGFQQTATVPHGDKIGFVILVRDSVEVMYQTKASVRDDEARVLEGPVPIGAAMLYIQVDDLEEVMRRMPRATPSIAERRKTFYGATETIVRDPAGNVIGFAQMG